MATPVHVPRVNNNDDEVKLVELTVAVGARVEPGQVIGQVETDKAVVEVSAPCAGYVLKILGEADQVMGVGKVLLWLGESADEAAPADAQVAAGPGGSAATGAPTAKALALLREHGLQAADVPSSGERLSVADVERFLAARTAGVAAGPVATAPVEREPGVAGQARSLSNSERGMLATVSWHRDFAVPGYIELEYDPAPWEAHAKAFAESHKLLFSPLLALMTFRLVELARDTPALNATIHAGKRHEYMPVNMGFTVQAAETLYLAVIRDAASRSALEFYATMLELQKRATNHALGPDETSGATIGFSSMARWKVARHMPILAPQTALMVAHAAPSAERAVLGASYDHRVLNGSQVVAALRKLSKP